MAYIVTVTQPSRHIINECTANYIHVSTLAAQPKTITIGVAGPVGLMGPQGDKGVPGDGLDNFTGDPLVHFLLAAN